MPITDLEKYRVIDNVNSYYRLTSESKRELLLNKYPNAAAAYSLRLLDGYYRGPLVRVRRDDGVEVDVYPDYNNQLSLDSLVTNVPNDDDTTTNPDINEDYTFVLSLSSLGEFVGATGYSSTISATDATVCVWYDQSSTDGVANENDAKQVTALNQPLIVSSGVIVTDNGKPALNLGGTNNVLSIGNVPLYSNTNGQSIFAVFNRSSSDGGVITKYSTASQREFRLTFGTSIIVYGVQSNPSSYNSNEEVVTPVSNDAQNLATAVWNPNTSTSVALNGGVFSNANSPAASATNTARSVNMGEYNDSTYMNGKLQELIIYPSDQSTNRTDIEEDINSFYQIDGYTPTPKLIDLTQDLAVQNGGTTADGTPAAAYSLRLLSSTYNGPLVRIRRTIDNTEVDVYPDSDGEFSIYSTIEDGGTELTAGVTGGSTDKTTLHEFLYGQDTDCMVVRWYDQASGNHATQDVATNQPKIYDSVTGVITKNGNYAAYSGSGQHLISSTPISNDGNWLALAVAARIDSTSKAMGLQASAFVAQLINYNSTYLQTIGYNGSVVSDISGVFTATTDVKLLCSQLVAGTLEAIVNGQSNGGTSLANQVTTAQPLGIFCKGGASETFNGYISEAILYVSDQSDNRTSIESNINQHYNIY